MPKITASTIETILNVARWAPSGDNSQPWSCRVVPPNMIALSWKRTDSVYDVGGWPTRLAIGAFLENIHLVANQIGVRAVIEGNVSYGTLNIRFEGDSNVNEDPLYDFILDRKTNRFKYSPFSLWKQEKRFLETVIPSRYSVLWFDSLADKCRIAKLNSQTMDLRLSLKSCYDAHVNAIDWIDDTYSETGIPSRALGLSPISRPIMRWVMEDWNRARTMFRFGGKFFPKLEMEILPALFTGSFAMIVDNQSDGINYRDDVAAGSFIQRFWLTATSLDIQMQPVMSPLVFARYADQANKIPNEDWSTYQRCSKIAVAVKRLSEGNQPVWFCRLGRGNAWNFARSTRKEI